MSSARNFARDLINMPPADLYPEVLANFASELVTDQISVEVWGAEKIIAENMGGMAIVLVKVLPIHLALYISYTDPKVKQSKNRLGWKRSYFDAGGLSLKSSAGMQTMRCDMSGSAAVLGVFKAFRLFGC